MVCSSPLPTPSAGSSSLAGPYLDEESEGDSYVEVTTSEPLAIARAVVAMVAKGRESVGPYGVE